MSDAGGLCVACGLCCDGTLFNRAKTTPAEAPRVRSYGLEVWPEERHFSLPCPRLDGTACTIYAERFGICRSFRCKLLNAVEAGEVPMARAGELVVEAKRLRDAAERAAPGMALAQNRYDHLRDQPHFTTLTDPQARGAAAKIYLAIAAVERFANDHFRAPRPAPLVPGAGSEEGEHEGAA